MITLLKQIYQCCSWTKCFWGPNLAEQNLGGSKGKPQKIFEFAFLKSL